MADFYVGDRVLCKIAVGNSDNINKTGTVAIVWSDYVKNDAIIGVIFDEHINGHDLHDNDGKPLCAFGYGWNVNKKYLVLTDANNDHEARFIKRG